MPYDAHKNLAYSTVATAPTPAVSGTSLVLATGQGTRFPATPFNATIFANGVMPDPTNSEIVRVTAIVGDTFTITRAQESTSARSVIVGDQIAATVTAKTITDIEAIAVVGGSNTQAQYNNSGLFGGSSGLTLNATQVTGMAFGGSPTITGTATFSGAITFSALLTASLGATISGAATSINASSNFATNINTGTSTGAVSIGNSLAGALLLASGANSSFTGTGGTTTFTISTPGGITLTTGASGNNISISAAGGGQINLTGAVVSANAVTIQASPLNFTAGAAFIFGTTDAFTVALKTGGTTRWTWASASPNVTLAAAADIIGAANTAAFFRITDGTTAIIALNGQTGTDNTATATITSQAAISYASAAGSTHSLLSLPAYTLTLTGGVAVTALAGLNALYGSPTVTSASVTTVTTASAVQIAGPLPAGSVTFANSIALDLLTYATNGTTASSIRIAAPTGAATNWAINVTSGASTFVGINVGGNAVSPVSGDIRGTQNIYGVSGQNLNIGATAAAVLITNNLQMAGGTILPSAPNNLILQNAADNNGRGQLTSFAYTAMTVEIVPWSVNAVTLTATGNYATQRFWNVASPTISSVAAQTITTAITQQVNGPLPAGSAVFTNSVTVDIPTYVTNGTTASGIRIAAPTGAATNWALNVTSGNVNVAGTGTYGGLLTSVGLTAGAGLIQGTLGLTITGAVVSLNASSNFATNINTGTSTGAVTIGNSAAAAVNITSNAASTFAFTGGAFILQTTSQALTVRTVTSGTLAVTSAGALNLTGGAASSLTLPDNTASAFVIQDSANTYHIIDTTNAASGVTVHSFRRGTSNSFASAAGNTFTSVGIAAFTIVQTGTTTVTAFGGLSLLVSSPTVTDASALTVTTASAVQINGPLPAGSVTFTNSIALDVPTYVTNGTTAAGIRAVAPSGAASNYAFWAQTGLSVMQTLTLQASPLNFTAGAAFVFGTSDNNTLALKTNNTVRWTWASASPNVTLAAAADVIGAANTASMFRVTDGTTALLAFDSRTGTDNINAALFTPQAAISYASANGTTFRAVAVAAFTLTLTGGVLVTALRGLGLNLGAPTVTSALATTVTDGSTLYVAAPVAAGAGPVTITNGAAIAVGGNILPDADNSYSVGSATRRFNLVRATTVTSGDLVFENDYRFTEADRLGLGPGIALLRPDGSLVQVFA